MRGFLGWLLLLAILGTVAFVVGPMVARPLIAEAVRSSVGAAATGINVDVDVDAADLVRLRVNEIHLTGSNVTAGHMTIGTLDATAADVSILDRSFASLTGSLEQVTIERSDGMKLMADHVDLSGSGDTVTATSTVGRAAALEIVGKALQEAGLTTEKAELIDGGVRVSVLGQSTDIALQAVDGAIAISGTIAGGGSIGVFGPEAGDPWQITGVTVSPSGLEVKALVDLSSVLRSR